MGMDMKVHSYLDSSILNVSESSYTEGYCIQQAAWHRYWHWEDSRCKQVVQLVRLPGHASRVITCFYLLLVTVTHSPHLAPPPANLHHLHLLLQLQLLMLRGLLPPQRPHLPQPHPYPHCRCEGLPTRFQNQPLMQGEWDPPL